MARPNARAKTPPPGIVEETDEIAERRGNASEAWRDLITVRPLDREITVVPAGCCNGPRKGEANVLVSVLFGELRCVGRDSDARELVGEPDMDRATQVRWFIERSALDAERVLQAVRSFVPEARSTVGADMAMEEMAAGGVAGVAHGTALALSGEGQSHWGEPTTCPVHSEQCSPRCHGLRPPGSIRDFGPTASASRSKSGDRMPAQELQRR